MSDTANAREPSMEDILASIRRIIDEEDTRDGRPTSGPAVDAGHTDGPLDNGPLPVMAAAAVNRENENDDTVYSLSSESGSGHREDDDHDDNGVSIFPERDSLFWSRATGRDESVPPADAVDERDQDAALLDAAMAGDGEHGDAEDDISGMAGTDIFTRAQNKLESTSRLSTRERMQSLAARAGERTVGDMDIPDDEGDASASGRIATLHDAGGPDDFDLDDRERDTSPDFSAAQGDRDGDDDGGYRDAMGAGAVDARQDETTRLAGDADVLELTDPIDRGDGPVSSESADTGMDRESDDYDDDSFYGASGRTDSAVAALEENRASAESISAEGVDDVFELTTPLDDSSEAANTGSVESGAAFRVSEIEAEAEAIARAEVAETGIEDVISRNLEENASPSDSDDWAARDENEIADTAPVENAPVEDDEGTGGFSAVTAMAGAGATIAAANTYSRLDHASDPRSQSTDESDDVEESDEAAAAMYSTAFTTLDEEASDVGSNAMDPADPPVAHDEQNHDGQNHDGQDHDGQDIEGDLGEGLGFSDTYGASDVYHDDPPVFDDDYSRSLEVEDEAITTQAAFASDTSAEYPQDDLETVGGLVRDAMERDPVDYADPSALVSMTSEEISARALASLSDGDGDANRRLYGSLKISDDGGGSESLEGMVREMLRPMLSEWLDDNLPTMVESAVRNEIERISAKSRKYVRPAEKD